MILKGYMMMMTLEEKIKIITAYHNKETVERLYEYDGVEVWQPVGLDAWNFELGQYRIKPNSAPKFKVGDSLVYKSDEGYKDIEVYKVTEATQEYYRLDDMVNKTPEYVEKEFINIKDALWYFEIFDFISREGHIYPTRITMSDINKELAPYHDALMWKPVYSLGFKLKEN